MAKMCEHCHEQPARRLLYNLCIPCFAAFNFAGYLSMCAWTEAHEHPTTAGGQASARGGSR